MNRVAPTLRRYAILCLMLWMAILNSACGASSLENAFAKGVTALRAARKVTTTQHQFGHITDDAYRARLELFKAIDRSVNDLADAVVDLASVSPENRPPLLLRINRLLGSIDQLIEKGAIGVTNPASQEEYRNQLLRVRLILSGVYAAIEILKTPTPPAQIKVKGV